MRAAIAVGLMVASGCAPAKPKAHVEAAVVTIPAVVASSLPAPPPADVDPCAGSTPTSFVVLTSDGDLLAFTPADASTSRLAHLDCPGIGFTEPFSMGLDRSGAAWVLFSDGRVRSSVYRVDPSPFACARTAAGSDAGLIHFGMGFASDPATGREHLYFSTAGLFGTIDTATYAVTALGHPRESGELTGTGDGRLFMFTLDEEHRARIFAVDRNTGATELAYTIPVGSKDDANAFAYWRGDFYLFTSSRGEPTTVTRFRPSDGTTTAVNHLSQRVVGAGVSTCARE